MLSCCRTSLTELYLLKTVHSIESAMGKGERWMNWIPGNVGLGYLWAWQVREASFSFSFTTSRTELLRNRVNRCWESIIFCPSMGYQKSSPFEILGEFPSKPKVRVSNTGLTNNLIITRRRRREETKKERKEEWEKKRIVQTSSEGLQSQLLWQLSQEDH